MLGVLFAFVALHFVFKNLLFVELDETVIERRVVDDALIVECPRNALMVHDLIGLSVVSLS